MTHQPDGRSGNSIIFMVKESNKPVQALTGFDLSLSSCFLKCRQLSCLGTASQGVINSQVEQHVQVLCLTSSSQRTKYLTAIFRGNLILLVQLNEQVASFWIINRFKRIDGLFSVSQYVGVAFQC